MQVIIDGMATSYQRFGQGQKRQVLVLHGWGDNSNGWQQFAHRLAKTHDVIVPDLPGFGGTDSPHKPWGLSDYADFVAKFVAKLDLQPYAIVGHSNGGGIAIRGLSSNKLKATKLVLLSSAGIRGEYKGRNKVLRLITKAGKLATMPLPSTVKKKLQKTFYTTVGSDMLVAEHLQETFKLVVEDDVRKDAAQLSLPTLLVYGQNDPATPLKYARLLNEAIKGSQLEIVPNAEHFVHLDQADKVMSVTEEFLA